MSYPQPSASREIVQGQQFFRLLTQIESSGDAYEMNTSAMAFCIGPQSDLGRARITYYDPEIAGNAQSFVVSVGDPFIGRVDSNLSQKYALANVPAQIIITPEDIIEGIDSFLTAPQFSQYDPATDYVALKKPNLDLLGYLAQPPAFPQQRADFIQRGIMSITNTDAGDGKSLLLFPYYRRRFASMQFTNKIIDATYIVTVYGCSLAPSGDDDSDIPESRVQVTQLATQTATFGQTKNLVIKATDATTGGLYDYLAFTFTGPAINAVNAERLFYTITMSDQES